MPQHTYSQDLAFLKAHVEVAELTDGRQARAAVTPAWQGRAMTSSLAGEDGCSFGWLNGRFISTGREDPVFNNYGGLDRLWLGPEAGQFGLWFGKDGPFDLEHWRTPAAFNAGPFDVTSQGHTSIAMARQFQVTNRAGTVFDCAVKRTISLLDAARAGDLLGMPIPEGVRMVGVESENALANVGQDTWTRDGGLLSVWILGQFKPLPRGKVIAPFRPGSVADFGPQVNTGYFGRIPPDRCVVTDSYILFACDGAFRSKIGLSPRRSRGVFGSYDPEGNVLAVVQFNQPLTASELPYVNSMWEVQAQPFAGDAINSYNDGEASPGAGQLGPFYEMETSSPAVGLRPGEALTHCHRTFHFTGDPDALNPIAQRLLTVDLRELPAGPASR